jgi:hypothetical protein
MPSAGAEDKPRERTPMYRTKVRTVDAIRMTEARRWDNKDWPDWLNIRWNRDAGSSGAVTVLNRKAKEGADDYGFLGLVGDDGSLEQIAWNDWLVYEDGVVWVCPDAEFCAEFDDVGVLGEIVRADITIEKFVKAPAKPAQVLITVDKKSAPAMMALVGAFATGTFETKQAVVPVAGPGQGQTVLEGEFAGEAGDGVLGPVEDAKEAVA